MEPRSTTPPWVRCGVRPALCNCTVKDKASGATHWSTGLIARLGMRSHTLSHTRSHMRLRSRSRMRPHMRSRMRPHMLSRACHLPCDAIWCRALQGASLHACSPCGLMDKAPPP